MIVDAFTDWRRAPEAELAREVDRLWRLRQFTTLGIAALLGVPEARVWNARRRLDGHGNGRRL